MLISDIETSDGSTKKYIGQMFAFYHTVLRANEKQKETDIPSGYIMKLDEK